MRRAIGQGRLLQLRPYGVRHAIKIFEYLIIPKSQDSKAGLLKVAGAFCIMLDRSIVGMLASVEFDNQSRIRTIKIDNIRPFGNLSFEFISVQAPIAQFRPEFLFSFCLFLSQQFCKIMLHQVQPSPLPIGERSELHRNSG